MKSYLILLLVLIISGSILANDCYPTEIPNKDINPYTSSEKDMKYHGDPYYYWTFNGQDWCIAGYFKPGDFGITGQDYRMKVIGAKGYEYRGGKVYIYATSQELDGKPKCNPNNNWQGKDFGPKESYLGNTYAPYNDCDIYADNWYYKKDITKFWIIYHIPTSPPPYPVSDDATDSKNSLTWDPSRQNWVPDIDIAINSGFVYSPCWCMHVVIEYPPKAVESTSLGTVKSLFN